MHSLTVSILVGLGIGGGVGFIFCIISQWIFKKWKLKSARQEASFLVETAKETFSTKHMNIINRVKDYKLLLLSKQRHSKSRFFNQKHQLESEVQTILNTYKGNINKKSKQKTFLLTDEQAVKERLKTKRQNLDIYLQRFREKRLGYMSRLKATFDLDTEALKKESAEQLTTSTKDLLLTQIKAGEDFFFQNILIQARLTLEQALCRFRRPYCPERGIKPVQFSGPAHIDRQLGKQRSFIQILEKECGVDYKLNEKDSSFSIFGIDPIRRELGRASLQGMVKQKMHSEKNVKSLINSLRKKLFQKIRSDGLRICRDLKLENMAPEVKNLMGALRYRYSFSQNQHFHCEEVGWLCGLLYAELGSADTLTGRRAGMLHDIGKAIDHCKEGGHAVIGADFIQQHGEKPHIVYAVKAHHHDVEPKSPLDFLVITADAISGARPGARHSTAVSYSQKIETLNKIGKSFKEVKEMYIMNAGRDVRVFVDSQKINDQKALTLSRKMAQKIEEECTYAGIITVTVVRSFTKRVDTKKLHLTP